MITNRAVAVLAAAPELDLKGGVVWLRGFGLLLLTVIFIYLTAKALLKHGQRGDTSGALSVTGATLLCLIPLAIGATVATITGYGGALLDVVTKILS